MTVARPHPDVIYEHVGGDAVLVNLRTNRIYSLNRTGARLWQLLVDGRGRAAIEATLAAEFDVDRATVAREVEELLESFRAARLTTGG